MEQDFFTNLPPEITINILSKLPIRAIIRCKSVCKAWLDLLDSRDFATHHLSNSGTPGLAVFQFKITSRLNEIYEFQDELDHLEHHHLHYKLLTSFELPSHGMIQGSSNGLLVLLSPSTRPYGLSICNPITREYAEIHSPREFDCTHSQVVTFGFGASRISGQLVRIFYDQSLGNNTPIPDCHVYTLETRSWRSISPSSPLTYVSRSIGALLNGNLHLLVFDSNGKPWISCFDLETELFSIISAPPPPLPNLRIIVADVFALGERLCVCDSTSEDEIVVWLMEEYGDGRSWKREFVIAKNDDINMYGECVVRPVKVFRDGDVAMAWGDFVLFYSPCGEEDEEEERGRRSVSEVKMFEARGNCAVNFIPHTSSFLSFKSLGMENVTSL